MASFFPAVITFISRTIAAVFQSPSAPKPDLYKGAEAWILAGGAHHTAFSYDLSVDQMVAWAEAMGIESVVIDENTDIRILKNELRWNEVVYR